MEVQMVPDQARPGNYATEMQPSAVFEELEKVKAERDLYYQKLMKVR